MRAPFVIRCLEKHGYPTFAQRLKLHVEIGAHVVEFLSSAKPRIEARIQKL